MGDASNSEKDKTANQWIKEVHKKPETPSVAKPTAEQTKIVVQKIKDQTHKAER